MRRGCRWGKVPEENAVDRHGHVVARDDFLLAHVVSALAYYHDHQREMDEAIEEDYREVKQIRAELGDTAIQLKLRLRAS